MLGVLGQGGMGVVYRARQLAANRVVALKMIRAVRDASPQERLRFQIETEAVARLSHPNIAQLYEAGEAGGQPFFSLEFCDGGALDRRLKARRPTPREAAALIEALARGLLRPVGPAVRRNGWFGVRICDVPFSRSRTKKVTSATPCR